MIKVSYSKNFLRQYSRLPLKIRQNIDKRILLWQKNPLNSQLRTHALKGKYKQHQSINVTGDMRALYLQHEDEVIFDIIGTHSQLYG